MTERREIRIKIFDLSMFSERMNLAFRAVQARRSHFAELSLGAELDAEARVSRRNIVAGKHPFGFSTMANIRAVPRFSRRRPPK